MYARFARESLSSYRITYKKSPTVADLTIICTLCQGQRKKPKQLEADFCILQESAFLNSIDI